MTKPIEILVWPETPRRLAFISDLHLQSARSVADQHRDQIRRAIASAQLCVWGGDLFDFRWSQSANEAAGIQQALQWLDSWYQEFPNTPFLFLNGNHDAHVPFVRALTQWGESRECFHANLECVRVGDTLLLHGDVIEGGGTPDAFAAYREDWQHKP
ncbi:MAG: metallophosphoesterase, partial [Rubripirellula sp.]